MELLIEYGARFLPKYFQQLWGRFKHSPLAVRLIQGSIWSFTGSLVSRVLALAAAVLVARVLGKASYGELGMVQTTIGMFGTLAGFGMGTTAAKFVAEFRTTDPMKAGKIISLSSLISWVSRSE
jgi:O-antigen/teichoic acid export membrane protein